MLLTRPSFRPLFFSCLLVALLVVPSGLAFGAPAQETPPPASGPPAGSAGAPGAQPPPAQGEPPPGRQIQLAEIPSPNMEGLEPRVVEELTRSRDLVLAMLQSEDGRIDPQALGLAYGELGLLYHAHDLFEEAAACYENARTLLGNAPKWHYALGVLREQQGDLEAARAALRQALAIDSADVPALYHLAGVELLASNTDEARRLSDRLLELAPNLPASRALAGEVAYAEGRHEDAIRFLEEVVGAMPEANRLHYPLGMSYRQTGNLDKAREHLAMRGTVGVTVPDPFTQALEQRRVGEKVHLLMGQTAFRAGRYQEAEELFRKAVEEEPENATGRVNLASALGAQGKRAEAIQELRRALALDAESTTARFNLASLLMQEGALPEAEARFREVLRATPEDTAAMIFLAKILQATQRPEDALELYGRALAVDPFQVDASLARSQLLTSYGRFDEALATLREAYQLSPTDGELVGALARFLAAVPVGNLRNGEAAVALAGQLYQAAPSALHSETLAMALAEAGRCEEAVSFQEQAIRLVAEGDPTRVPARMAQHLQLYRTERPCRIPATTPEGS